MKLIISILIDVTRLIVSSISTIIAVNISWFSCSSDTPDKIRDFYGAVKLGEISLTYLDCASQRSERDECSSPSVHGMSELGRCNSVSRVITVDRGHCTIVWRRNAEVDMPVNGSGPKSGYQIRLS